MFFVTRCVACSAVGHVVCPACVAHFAVSPPVSVADGVVAVTEFVGVARAAVLGLKYRNRRAVVAFLADHLAAVVAARPDVVTWAPTSTRRVARRGYDQAELLARALARRLGVPCRRLLRRRHDAGRPQTGLARRDRLASPGFEARVPAGRPRVLVVDDVVTTGATLRAAVVALRGAGAGAVQCVAVAATPPWRPAQRGGPGATTHR